MVKSFLGCNDGSDDGGNNGGDGGDNGGDDNGTDGRGGGGVKKNTADFKSTVHNKKVYTNFHFTIVAMVAF